MTAARIWDAVNNEEWQIYRHSMKGTPTREKLDYLYSYWNYEMHANDHVIKRSDKVDVFQYDCDVCIRVDNYIKALCRGGQLYPGESIYTVLFSSWNPRIKK